MTSATSPRDLLDLRTPVQRTLTVEQSVALGEHLDGFDSDAYPLDPVVLDALLAATGQPTLVGVAEDALKGALDCALWLGTTVVWADDAAESEPLDLRDRGDEVSDAALDHLRAEVQQFVVSNRFDLVEALRLYTLGAEHTVGEQIGHDFMLTRNGHGTGFWDRGLGDVGDRLSQACKPYGDYTVEADGENLYIPGQG